MIELSRNRELEPIRALVERFGIDLYGRDALPLRSYTPDRPGMASS